MYGALLPPFLYFFLRWCVDILTAVMQAGVVETHISLLVCGTPNGADSSLCCVVPNVNTAWWREWREN